jgi:hypothetical protein
VVFTDFKNQRQASSTPEFDNERLYKQAYLEYGQLTESQLPGTFSLGATESPLWTNKLSRSIPADVCINEASPRISTLKLYHLNNIHTG